VVEQFPGNSHRITTPAQAEKKPVEEQPKLKPVGGKVIKRKKPLGRRLLDTFFSSTTDSVFGYLGKQVLLPALQDLVIGLVTQGIEKAVNGEVRTPYRAGSRGVQRTHINYTAPSSSIIRSNTSANARAVREQPTPSTTVDEYVLESLMHVELVLEEMTETIGRYGAVTVANLKELLEETPTYTDSRWGWTDLSQMSYKRIAGGYLLLVPPPEDLR
jgi:hypothetical protein